MESATHALCISPAGSPQRAAAGPGAAPHLNKKNLLEPMETKEKPRHIPDILFGFRKKRCGRWLVWVPCRMHICAAPRSQTLASAHELRAGGYDLLAQCSVTWAMLRLAPGQIHPGIGEMVRNGEPCAKLGVAQNSARVARVLVFASIYQGGISGTILRAARSQQASRRTRPAVSLAKLFKCSLDLLAKDAPGQLF